MPIYRFEIPFKLKSKKNNRPIFKNKATGRVFLGKSSEYKSFETDLLFVLNAQKNALGISKPLTGDLRILRMVIECKGAQRSDLDNQLTSVFDALQDARIIENDKQFKHIRDIWVMPHKGRDHTSLEIEPLG